MMKCRPLTQIPAKFATITLTKEHAAFRTNAPTICQTPGFQLDLTLNPFSQFIPELRPDRQVQAGYLLFKLTALLECEG